MGNVIITLLELRPNALPIVIGQIAPAAEKLEMAAYWAGHKYLTLAGVENLISYKLPELCVWNILEGKSTVETCILTPRYHMTIRLAN